MTSDFVIWGALALLTAVFIAASRWAGWDGQPASGPGRDRQVSAGASAPGGPGADSFSSPPTPGPDPFAGEVMPPEPEDRAPVAHMSVPWPVDNHAAEMPSWGSGRPEDGPGHPGQPLRQVIRTAPVQGVWLPLTAAYDNDDTLIDCLPRQCAGREPARPARPLQPWIQAILNAPIEDIRAGAW